MARNCCIVCENGWYQLLNRWWLVLQQGLVVLAQRGKGLRWGYDGWVCFERARLARLAGVRGSFGLFGFFNCAWWLVCKEREKIGFLGFFFIFYVCVGRVYNWSPNNFFIPPPPLFLIWIYEYISKKLNKLI